MNMKDFHAWVQAGKFDKPRQADDLKTSTQGCTAAQSTPVKNRTEMSGRLECFHPAHPSQCRNGEAPKMNYPAKIRQEN